MQIGVLGEWFSPYEKKLTRNVEKSFIYIKERISPLNFSMSVDTNQPRMCFHYLHPHIFFGKPKSSRYKLDKYTLLCKELLHRILTRKYLKVLFIPGKVVGRTWSASNLPCVEVNDKRSVLMFFFLLLSSWSWEKLVESFYSVQLALLRWWFFMWRLLLLLLLPMEEILRVQDIRDLQQEMFWSNQHLLMCRLVLVLDSQNMKPVPVWFKTRFAVTL